MVTWAQKIAFVGMSVRDVDGPCRFNVRVCHNPGASSYGSGPTLEKAIEDAAIGLRIDWDSVTRKITDKEWELIAHT
jgi:hypothetical protein